MREVSIYILHRLWRGALVGYIDHLGGGGIEGETFSYEKAIAEPRSHFIAEIIYFSTGGWVGGCALALQVFGMGVEDLVGGGAGDLDGEFPMVEVRSPPEGWARKKWPQ